MTLTVRLGTADPIAVRGRPDGPVHVPLDQLVQAFDWHLTELGEGSVGLCPDEDRCIPIPGDAVLDEAGGRLVDLSRVSAPLGIAVVRHDDLAAVVAHDMPGEEPRARSGSGIELQDVHSGEARPLVAPGRRRCVFAWASW